MEQAAETQDPPQPPRPDDLSSGDRSWACDVAVRLVGGRALAEDMVQETILKVMERRFEGQEERRRYFLRALTNTCLSELRRQRSEQHVLSDHAQERASSGEATDPLERHELAARVRAAVAKLAPRQRVAVVLKFWEGFDTRQVAEALGVSESGAATLAYRGFTRLRAELPEEDL